MSRSQNVKPDGEGKKLVKDYSAQCSRAKSVKEYTEEWTGIGPKELDPEIDMSEVERLEIDHLIGEPLTIFGFSKRSGNLGDFAVVLCVPESTNYLSTFVTGGSVILRKLGVVADRKGFPVKGTVAKPEGKKYFDLI